MPQPKQAAPKAAAPKLPPISVAKFEIAMQLLERLAAENTEKFIDKGQEFRAQHHAATERKLNETEAARVAAAIAAGYMPADATPEQAMAEVPPAEVAKLAARVQEESLQAWDEPASQDVLMHALVALAPALPILVMKLLVLVEMPDDELRPLAEQDELGDHEALDEALMERVREVRWETLESQRKRAQKAFEHFAKAAGFKPGKAMGLIAQSLWGALVEAMGRLNAATDSASSSPTASATPTGSALNGLSTTPPTSVPGS